MLMQRISSSYLTCGKQDHGAKSSGEIQLRGLRKYQAVYMVDIKGKFKEMKKENWSWQKENF